MNGEKTFHCVYVCRCRYIDLCVCIYVHMYVSFMHMHVNVLCMRCCRLASLEAADAWRYGALLKYICCQRVKNLVL